MFSHELMTTSQMRVETPLALIVDRLAHGQLGDCFHVKALINEEQRV